MADQEQLEINLKILSPSTGIEGGVHLPHLPASTTVQQLRLRIQNAVPTKPATENMRLIYRGRVVANDTDTLLDVFGRDNIRESKDQSLHLVLRELHPQPVNTANSTSGSTSTSASSSPDPRSTTAPPNVLRPAQGPPPPGPTPNNPFRLNPYYHPRHHHHHHHHLAAHQPLINLGPHPIPDNLERRFPPRLRHAANQNGAQNNVGAPSNQTSQTGGSTTAPGDGTQQQQQQPQQPQQPPQGPQPNPGIGTPFPRVIRDQDGTNRVYWTVERDDLDMNVPGRPPQPLLPRPFPHPPGFPLPARPAGSPAPTSSVNEMLIPARLSLESARNELENIRALIRVVADGQTVSAEGVASLNPPAWRMNQIERHVQSLTGNLDNAEQGLESILLDPSMTLDRYALALRQTAHDLRTHTEFICEMMLRSEQTARTQALYSAQTNSSRSTTSSVSTALPPPNLSQAQLPQTNSLASQSNIPTELFILSSPQGPVGILFDQQGTYRTAPMVSTLPFQTFTDQFARNRQLIAGLGQQIAQSTTQLQDQLTAVQQQQAVVGAQPAVDQAQNQNQDQNNNQNQDANQNANPQGENDRMVVIAGHLWLIFKLLCFVYLFAGGGGWYRPMMMCIIALGVYVAQLGVFDNQFNIVRRHFEALLPLADRAAQDPNRPAQNANTQDQQQTGANRNITPEDAARRLIQQHRDERAGWVRESMRAVERSFAIFVASLWPGIGERMVQAQEERIRAERAAEEERLRSEEEARTKEVEEAREDGDEKKEKEGVGEYEGEESSEQGSSSSGKGKGKVKVEVPSEEGLGAS